MVYVMLAEGFEEIEALTVVDILRRAGVGVQMVSVANTEAVTGAHGITVLADRPISAVENEMTEMIILPGGMPGAAHLKENLVLREMIRNTHRAGGYLAAICAAPIVLAAAGLLEGKRAVCYPGFESELGAMIVDKDVAKDGNIITAKGPGVVDEFAFTLLELLRDWPTVYDLREAMLYTQNGYYEQE